MNPGFSSTSGVLISMARFNQVTYHAHSDTAEVGSGLVWDQVYAALEPYNVSVVGARATGVGVGGFLLGGGILITIFFSHSLIALARILIQNKPIRPGGR